MKSLKRAKGRLRCALGFTKTSKRSTSSSRGLKQDQHDPSLVRQTTSTPIKSPTSEANSTTILSPSHGSQVRSIFKNPTFSTSNSHLPWTNDMNTIPTTLGPESVPSSAFLSLPAEIRNHIYRCLLPDVTNLRDTAGLVCACKQIRQELTSMIVAETMPVIQAVQQQSMAFYKSTYATSMARSFVSVPAVKNHSQLCNVNFSISIGNGMSHHPSGVRYPAFTTVFGGLKSLLSLHLPYVTISVPVILQEDETLGDPLLRERFLGTCYTAFKMVEADPNCNINAHHVIFEVGKEKWEGHEFVHPPVIAFVRQASKKGKVGYEVLGYDPAAEIDDEIGRAIETDESMIERLRLILKKSRDAARDGN